MSMVFCRGCGKDIHETANGCPFCGCIQHPAVTTPPHLVSEGELGMPITSLIFGIICVLTLFDESQWDNDTLLGLGIFAVIGLILGVISISKHTAGKNMAITGVVLSSITLLIFISMSLP